MNVNSGNSHISVDRSKNSVASSFLIYENAEIGINQQKLVDKTKNMEV